VPRTTDAVPRLEHDPVVDPGFVELDRRTDAGESGADHHNLMVRSHSARIEPKARRPRRASGDDPPTYLGVI
jgi:hypothetical protein